MDELTKIIVEANTRAKNNSQRLDRLEDIADAIHKQGEALAIMATELKHNNEAITAMTGRVGELEKRPGTLWDKLIMAIVGAIGGGIGGAVIALVLR